MTLEETNKQYLLNGMETALCLCSQKVLPNSPIYGKEFHLLGNGIYIGNFIDSLWLDHTIPKYDSCYAYYKTFDAHCTACQICIYSSYYRNIHQTEELELLRYAFQSPQNLNHLKNIGLNAVCFRSVYNLTQSLITAEQPRLFQLHKILYKLLNKSIDRYFRSEFVGRSFDYKLQIKLIEELSALNLPADYCTEDWYKKQILIFEDLIFSVRPKSADEIENYLKSVMKKEKYTPPKVNKLKNIQKDSASVLSDIHTASFIYSKNETNEIFDNNNKDSLEETTFTAHPLNPKQNIHLDNNSSDYTDGCKTDSFDGEDFRNKEYSPYNSPISEIGQKNNLIYIPTIKETELSACAVSLSTRNTLILSKFESAVLTGKRMIIEVVKSDSGTTYLLIWIPRIHAFFYSDLTEPISNNILFPLFSKKQILKITYSPYWIYSLIYQYTKKRTYGIESIQFMHCLTEYTTLEYVSVFRSHGIIPTSVEAISISYDMAFWLSKTSFLFTMPAPFSYKFNPVDLRRLKTDGYLLVYQAEYLNELPYPFFQEVLALLVENNCNSHC